jgi:hypothetical protein
MKGRAQYCVRPTKPPAHLLARLKERDIIAEVVLQTPVGEDIVSATPDREIQPK